LLTDRQQAVCQAIVRYGWGQKVSLVQEQIARDDAWLALPAAV
jgi:hypothetical protein